MDLKEMSGLEVLQAIVDRKLPPPSMAETMSLRLERVEKGYAEFSATAGEQHLNPAGTVHGGFAATALDSVTGCAIHTMLGPGDIYSTIDLNVKMIKAVPVGAKLKAESKVIQVSKRLGTSYGNLIDEKGTIYAHATATCLVTRSNSSVQSKGWSDGSRHSSGEIPIAS